jgi:hypothetical protein
MIDAPASPLVGHLADVLHLGQHNSMSPSDSNAVNTLNVAMSNHVNYLLC